MYENQHVNIDLQNHITDNVNIVELYFCPKKQEKQDSQYPFKIINTNVDESITKVVETRFKNCKEETYKSYSMKDKIYTYELTNDNQIVSSKYKTMAKYIPRCKSTDIFIISSKLEKYPSYIFPCTDEIDNISTYSTKEFKINNRISIIIRKEDDLKSVYIEYKHSQNVELDKMNEIMNRLIKSL